MRRTAILVLTATVVLTATLLLAPAGARADGKLAPTIAMPEIVTAVHTYNEALHVKGATIRIQQAWIGSWTGRGGREALVLWRAIPKAGNESFKTFCGVDLLLAAPERSEIHFSGRLPWAGGKNPLPFCPADLRALRLERPDSKPYFLVRGRGKGGANPRGVLLHINGAGELAPFWEGEGQLRVSDTDRDQVNELTWDRRTATIDEATFLREGEAAARLSVEDGMTIESVKPAPKGRLRIEGTVREGSVLYTYIHALRASPRFPEVEAAGSGLREGNRFALDVLFLPNAGQDEMTLVWRDGGFVPTRVR